MSEFRTGDGQDAGSRESSRSADFQQSTPRTSTRPEPTTASRTSASQDHIGPDRAAAGPSATAGLSVATSTGNGPSDANPRPHSDTGRRSSIARLALRYILLGAVAATLFFALIITAYRWVNPPMSALMVQQRLGGIEITQHWVPLEQISPNLVRAVIMSEDAGFCRHRGVDLRELEAAIEASQDGVVRGGSTISMQTAKNLFLWPSRSYVRKAMEIPLTFAMEAAWTKRRMLEIYLNIAEWGPGIFGAEAAARYHFRKSASRLTEQEAALLAVSLPAPLVREPGRPSVLLNRMSQTIVVRMRSSTRHTSCVLPGRS